MASGAADDRVAGLRLAVSWAFWKTRLDGRAWFPLRSQRGLKHANERQGRPTERALFLLGPNLDARAPGEPAGKSEPSRPVLSAPGRYPTGAPRAARDRPYRQAPWFAPPRLLRRLAGVCGVAESVAGHDDHVLRAGGPLNAMPAAPKTLRRKNRGGSGPALGRSCASSCFRGIRPARLGGRPEGNACAPGVLRRRCARAEGMNKRGVIVSLAVAAGLVTRSPTTGKPPA
jgi:hypothetical protein